jgi:preprotein translocase subunit SecD
MKTIIYVLIAVFTASILYSAIPQTVPQNTQIVTLTAVTQQISSNQLESAVEVLTKRIEDFGIKKPSVKVNTESNSIQFALNEELNAQELSFLLLSKGELAFYETFNRNDVVEALSSDKELAKILDIPSGVKSPGDYSSIIGFSMPQNKESATRTVQKIATQHGMKVNFIWSGVPYFEGKYVLHMLHPQSAINKNAIENTKVVQDERSGAYQLSINFNKEGARIWSEVTKNNIGKNISIALDGSVLSSPRVMAQIKGGKAMISGKFSENDLKLISALANNDNLPLSFKIE